MSAQDAVDNTRAKQGVQSSIDPNFAADQLQEIVDALVGTTGWAQYNDTVLTSVSPQVISQGTTSVIQNNGLSVIESQLPMGVASFYDAATQKITPDTSGDSYVVRISFTAFTSSNAGALATIQLDIGGAQNVILKRGFTFPKGSGVANAIDISTTNLVYSLGTFVANGGEVQIFSEVGDTSIYDVSYVVDRVHKGRV